MTTVHWLLDSDPSVRWQALRDLADAPADVVAAERARVATEGQAAQLLTLQAPDGRFYVLEVNSMPAWNGLQRVSRVRISDQLVDAFLGAVLPKQWLEGCEGA